MSESGFTIDKVSWHSQTVGNPERRPEIDRRFRHLFAFLSENRLLTENAPVLPPGTLPDEFMLHSSHLTELGLRVLKAGYDPWLKAIDRGAEPEKAKGLEGALAKALAAKA